MVPFQFNSITAQTTSHIDPGVRFTIDTGIQPPNDSSHAATEWRCLNSLYAIAVFCGFDSLFPWFLQLLENLSKTKKSGLNLYFQIFKTLDQILNLGRVTADEICAYSAFSALMYIAVMNWQRWIKEWANYVKNFDLIASHPEGPENALQSLAEGGVPQGVFNGPSGGQVLLKCYPFMKLSSQLGAYFAEVEFSTSTIGSAGFTPQIFYKCCMQRWDAKYVSTLMYHRTKDLLLAAKNIENFPTEVYITAINPAVMGRESVDWPIDQAFVDWYMIFPAVPDNDTFRAEYPNQPLSLFIAPSQGAIGNEIMVAITYPTLDPNSHKAVGEPVYVDMKSSFSITVRAKQGAQGQAAAGGTLVVTRKSMFSGFDIKWVTAGTKTDFNLDSSEFKAVNSIAQAFGVNLF